MVIAELLDDNRSLIEIRTETDQLYEQVRKIQKKIDENRRNLTMKLRAGERTGDDVADALGIIGEHNELRVERYRDLGDRVNSNVGKEILIFTSFREEHRPYVSCVRGTNKRSPGVLRRGALSHEQRTVYVTTFSFDYGIIDGKANFGVDDSVIEIPMKEKRYLCLAGQSTLGVSFYGLDWTTSTGKIIRKLTDFVHLSAQGSSEMSVFRMSGFAPRRDSVVCFGNEVAEYMAKKDKSGKVYAAARELVGL